MHLVWGPQCTTVDVLEVLIIAAELVPANRGMCYFIVLLYTALMKHLGHLNIYLD